MSKTILADVDGFTPVIDELARKYGLVTAAVFGKIWRYCQMKDGICRATMETLSDGLGVDAATINRHAKILCEEGYLEDTTPGLKRRPHIYRDTGKGGLRVLISSGSPIARDEIGIAHSNSGIAECNSGIAQRNTGIAESRLKRVTKKEKETKEEITAAPKPRGNPELHALAQAIADVCRMNLEANRGRLFKEAKLLSVAQPTPTPDLVKAHYNGNPSAFWKADDWRGRKGQAPTPQAIRETWGQWGSGHRAGYAAPEPVDQAELDRISAILYGDDNANAN